MTPRGWTIGVELELADVERDLPLPGRSVWDRKDYTIVNSNGVANDPTGRIWRYGAEVNTEPTGTVATQVEVVDQVLRACRPVPVVNYRCNLHVHVRVPGLAEDVARVRRLVRYIVDTGAAAFALVDPLPPKPEGHDDVARGARQRWRRRAVSHHYLPPASVVDDILAANTPDRMRLAHAAMGQRGSRLPMRWAIRWGVNVRALWETAAHTVEFRHFCMSLRLAEVRDAMQWCVLYLVEGLGDQRPPQCLLWPGAAFPRQPLYDHWLETRYRASSLRYHTEAEVRAVLACWAQEGTLDAPLRRVPDRGRCQRTLLL